MIDIFENQTEEMQRYQEEIERRRQLLERLTQANNANAGYIEGTLRRDRQPSANQHRRVSDEKQYKPLPGYTPSENSPRPVKGGKDVSR